MPHFYPHALRHTFATWCFETGVDADAKGVQGFLGHCSIAITLDLYAHVTNDKAKTEMDRLQELCQHIT
ncbi:MAG: tyrosine-type recombinase/integrase [[Clostridium] scindens]|uniref:tyrosine-type recombinase/integrase n=1 Tax=Clostridium scindens (strain JCM 10418 / VPI 12708) TaxID=29347 RepID=UPI00399A2EAB